MAEKEYIERKALLQDIDETVIVSGKTGATNQELRGINKVIGRIQAIPTADVQEIVWCSNCIHIWLHSSGYYYCSVTGKKYKGYELGYHFCSYGAKMDKE